MRDDRERLRDIIEAIARIDRYAARGREVFQRDELIQSWILRRIQLIGEAAGRLSESLRREHSEVPWPALVAMRNVLVHGYFQVDLDEVWTAVARDLPSLKERVEAILGEPDTGQVSERPAAYRASRATGLPRRTLPRGRSTRQSAPSCAQRASVLAQVREFKVPR